MSRNMATIHVGEQVGFDKVAALWRRLKIGTPPEAYPSIALGVFELTPFEVAQAYTLFMNRGSVRPLHAIDRIDAGGKQLRPSAATLTEVARPETTFLVTNMMRSVLNDGTGASARGNGFTHDAAGKSGTTNDMRDAWFVGFTPELLTVVWVGYDDNTPVGLTGSQAALPIWTDFMKAALAGRSNVPFPSPEGISWAEIDRRLGGGVARQQAVGESLAGGAAGCLAGVLRTQVLDQGERELAQPLAVRGDQRFQPIGQRHARQQVAGIERSGDGAPGGVGCGRQGLEAADVDGGLRGAEAQAVLLAVQAGGFAHDRRQSLADRGQRLAQARLALALGALRPDPLGERLAGRAALPGQRQGGQDQGGLAGGQGDRGALRGRDGQAAEKGKRHGFGSSFAAESAA
jgi:hypothetical protein